MENYQIIALALFVPACVYFNWQAGYKAGVHVGINSAITLLEKMGAIDIKIVNGEEVVTIKGQHLNKNASESE